jgi:hypothetical protein
VVASWRVKRQRAGGVELREVGSTPDYKPHHPCF